METKKAIVSKKSNPRQASERSNVMIAGGTLLALVSIGLLSFVIKTKIF
ncbi:MULTISPECIES: hypothetical protein [Prochlorococcus]|nr:MULTISPECIES: hypothetical protein [Prochlorococcus]KGG18656.1 hypothetical protein EV08_1904 [Prochlorococcus marinus str. SS2]KGG11388.1 hypothetical protein EV04_1467 [Prochlorococcus marinus str. LG]KGG22929.1 hypothetical protein EV09_1671 [Prochlorococcus marinus str. SS35]KGG34033.1 hypothetical protein EV10_0069 [Prochlorococcus marinus str. SS51]KGG37490.1 hypothetical protein EV11_0048 [Prochlorococcus sp. SS52]